MRSLIKKLFPGGGFQRYFLNTSWMFFEQILRMVSGLFVGVWVARYLGPTDFGVFNYVLAFSSIFTGLAKLGLDSIIVRDLVNHATFNKKYLGTAFWLKFLGGVLSLITTFTAAILFDIDYKNTVFILIISSAVLFQSFEVIDFYFQSRILSKLVSACKIIQILTSSLLKIYLITIKADLIWFFVVTLWDQIILSIAYYFSYKLKNTINFYRNFDYKIGVNLLKSSWPLIFNGLVLMIQARSDQLMLKQIVNAEELGYYSSAMRLVEAFGFIPLVITGSLFPAIVNAKRQSFSIYIERLEWLYMAMMFIFLVIAIPIYFFSDFIIVNLYGYAYYPAGDLLSIMIIRFIFTSYGVVRSAYLINENLFKYSFISMSIGAIVNVLLNYFLIPVFYSRGAILASFISLFLSTFLIDIFYSKSRINGYLMIRSIFFMRILRGR